MRKIAAFLAAAGLAAALIVVPTPATAAELPPPVVDLPDIPSRVTKVSIADFKAFQILPGRNYVMKNPMTPTTPTTEIATIPKPITKPGPITRPANAGGPLVAFQGGWAIGQGGLALYAVATGSDYNEMICAQPDWYQVANSFMMLGLAGCRGHVAQPNFGLVGDTWSSIATGGWTISYLRTHTNAPDGNWWQEYCYTVSGTAPAGVGLQGMRINGQWGNVGTPQSWTGSGCSPARYLLGPNFRQEPTQLASPGLRIIDTQTQAVIGTMQQGSADPTRTPTCTISWENGSTTTGTGTQYSDTGGIPMTAAGLGCEQAYVSQPGRGPALMPDRITVESDDGTSKTTISDQEVPPMTEVDRKPFGPTNGRGLVLEKVVNGTTFSCMTWAVSCKDWWSQSQNGTNESTYRCTYGGQAIPLIECGAYRDTFQTPTNNPTVNPDPPGISDPQPPITWPPTVTPPAPGPTPTDVCIAAWSEIMNPIEWVLQPVKCALVWAFVPTQTSVTTAQTTLTEAWENKPPAQIITAVSGWAPHAEVAGCSITVEIFSGEYRNSVTPVDACAGSWVEPITVISRLLVSAGMIVLVVVILRRQIAGMVNYNVQS